MGITTDRGQELLSVTLTREEWDRVIDTANSSIFDFDAPLDDIVRQVRQWDMYSEQLERFQGIPEELS
jgi:hypothetical protein